MEMNHDRGGKPWGARLTIRVCAALAVFALAASAALPEGAPSDAAAGPPAYRPTIADLMVLGVQPRHIKIAIALRDQNWAYAAYETRELGGVLNRISRAVPLIDRKYDTAMMIQSTVTMPLHDLGDAIKAKDAAASAAAYAALTKACTGCHQAVNHGVIIIKIPRTDAYPDQDFRPQAAGTP
jgi:hypothetical protein